MENLNLNLQELKCIASVLKRNDKTDSQVKRTINKAIEACETKAKQDNDYQQKFYSGFQPDTRYTCSVNLTLLHGCEQI
jgi:hypothetical protein